MKHRIYSIAALLALSAGTLSAYPRFVAHRGAPHLATENTVASFRKAAELGAWAIEMDVRRCAGGTLVVAHDPDLTRIAGEAHLIATKSLPELQNLTLKNGGNIPTLEQALDAIDKRTTVILDLKNNDMAGDVARVILQYVTTKGWRYDQFWATGFEFGALEELHKILPHVRISPTLCGSPRSGLDDAKAIGATAVTLVDLLFSQEIYNEAKKRGLEVWVALFNEHPTMVKHFVDLGVDAVIMNNSNNLPPKPVPPIEQPVSLCWVDLPIMLEKEQELRNLYVRGFAHARNQTITPELTQRYENEFARDFEQFKQGDLSYLLCLAENGTKIVGFGLFKVKSENNVAIKQLCVEPEYWKHECCKQLVFVAPSTFPSLTNLEVEIQGDLVSAQRFFASLGFALQQD